MTTRRMLVAVAALVLVVATGLLSANADPPEHLQTDPRDWMVVDHPPQTLTYTGYVPQQSPDAARPPN